MSERPISSRLAWDNRASLGRPVGGIYRWEPGNPKEEGSDFVVPDRAENWGWRLILSGGQALAPATPDARDFGARGDIKTDDSDALQRLLDGIGAYAGDFVLRKDCGLTAALIAEPQHRVQHAGQVHIVQRYCGHRAGPGRHP